MKKSIIIAVVVSLLAITMYFTIPTRVIVVSSDYEVIYYRPELNASLLDTDSLIEYLEDERFIRKFGRGVGIDKTKSVVITLLPKNSSFKPLEIIYNEGEIALSYIMVGNHYFKLSEADMVFLKELL